MAGDNLSHEILRTRALLLLRHGLALSPDEISRLQLIAAAPSEKDRRFLAQFDQYLVDEEPEDRDEEEV
jgi:hypothetical protein